MRGPWIGVWGRLGVAVAVAAVVAAGGAGILARGQQPAAFRSGVETVAVYATVRSNDGQIQRGLTRDDFELLDNGQHRDIAVFSNDIQPITLAIVLDRSGSIGDQAQHVTAAAEAFVRKLLPDDQASVSSLSWDCQTLTTKKDTLITALRGQMPEDMGSPIWAGLDRVMGSLDRETGRRAVLLFSDGNDTGFTMDPSPAWKRGSCQPSTGRLDSTREDAARHAEREGMITYAVSVDSRYGTNAEALKAIAHDSGGQLYQLKQDSDLTAAFTDIADELHSQYLLGFVPATFDGKLHSLEVKVKRPGLVVRARKTYLSERGIVASPEADRRAFASRKPWPALTSADIDAAIRDGIAGKRLQAACSASGAFPDQPAEEGASVRLVAEGPMGRIMHAGRDFKPRGVTMVPRLVTEAMRANVVVVTAELNPMRSGTLSPRPLPRGGPPGSTIVAPTMPVSLTNMRLAGRSLSGIVIAPIAVSPVPPPVAAIRSLPGLMATFDMGAFRALPGDEVEIIVTSPAGERRCSLSPAEVREIR